MLSKLMFFCTIRLSIYKYRPSQLEQYTYNGRCLVRAVYNGRCLVRAVYNGFCANYIRKSQTCIVASNPAVTGSIFLVRDIFVIFSKVWIIFVTVR